MTIKGKGKTRQKQAPRAPRRAPVPVKPPFFQRGWVKAVAAFLGGLLVMSMVWWAWENLDKERNSNDLATAQGQQQQALSAWAKGNLEPTLSTVGQLQGGGTPQIATNVGTALDALAKGDDPGVTADDMTAIADKLDKAAKALDKFGVGDVISGHGFDSAQMAMAKEAFDTGQSLLQHGWNSYANIAALAGVPLPAPQGLASGGLPTGG
jgi:hypothetical protein